jgi:hypothetical protein
MEFNDRPALLQHVGRNAYRVLGLPADASRRAISERAAALDRAARVGIKRPPSPWDLEWYGQSKQDRSAISDALERLNNPRQRLGKGSFGSRNLSALLRIFPRKRSITTIDSLRSSPLPADNPNFW